MATYFQYEGRSGWWRWVTSSVRGLPVQRREITITRANGKLETFLEPLIDRDVVNHAKGAAIGKQIAADARGLIATTDADNKRRAAELAQQIAADKRQFEKDEFWRSRMRELRGF